MTNTKQPSNSETKATRTRSVIAPARLKKSKAFACPVFGLVRASLWDGTPFKRRYPRQPRRNLGRRRQALCTARSSPEDTTARPVIAPSVHARGAQLENARSGLKRRRILPRAQTVVHVPALCLRREWLPNGCCKGKHLMYCVRKVQPARRAMAIPLGPWRDQGPFHTSKRPSSRA